MKEDILKKLRNLIETAKKEIKAIKTEKELEEKRIKYLGRKSELISILRKVRELPENERSEVGKKANDAKKEIKISLQDSLKITAGIKLEKLKEESIDLTYPGKDEKIGRLHPITQMYNEVVQVFTELGFTIMEGPDIEDDWHTFEMLRMPKDHPARDAQDTYYIKGMEILPRTHTSAAQSRAMIQQKPPIKILVPGRCYRNEKVDPRHTDIFYQFEGLVINETASLKDLKATLTEAFRRLLESEKINIRFRHSHFPYTEPSIEVDGTCAMCEGKGCRVCSKSGWVELCGAGMVHPEVLENFGIDSEKYQGYAFGPGIERFIMLKYQLPDLRLLLENDLRTLKQF